MPSLLEEIADALARDVLKASQELRDDDLVNEISKVIGTSSPTTQEAFLTAVRIRMAESRARKALAEKLGKRSWDEAAAAPAPVRDEAVAARRPAPGQPPAVEQGAARVQAVRRERSDDMRVSVAQLSALSKYSAC